MIVVKQTRMSRKLRSVRMKFKIDKHEAAIFMHLLEVRGQIRRHRLRISAVCFRDEQLGNAYVSDDWIQVYLVFGASFEPLQHRICGKNSISRGCRVNNPEPGVG